ncbi:MAG TPA: TIGR03016 family PEP-CTERM system-associated outer membrane protein [Casimicrobiaceae bacterium]
MLAGGCALFTATACAQTWQFQPSGAIRETLTDNVNLAPSDRARTDLVTQITPGFTVSEQGGRTSLSGNVRVPILLYARTGGENDKVLPEGNLKGRIEAVEDFLFVEGAASAQQAYFTPFGAQPVSLANATANRYRADSYRVSPYLKSPTSREIRYELRDDNTWTRLAGAPAGANDSYTNRLTGKVFRDPTPVGWAVEIERTSDKFVGQRALVTELARARLPVQIDPEIRASVSGGYEDNRYTFTEPRGAIYGGGAEWRPAPRTAVKGEWEHRFFGSSYQLSFDNRTPLSTWNVKASRNLTSYPQQLASLPAGGDVAATLNQLFLSRIPDPAERQSVVDQIISSAGLPAFLSNPITLYAQQVYLQELARATVGILGVRNHLLLTAYRSRTQPIAGSGTPLPPELAAQNNNTQTGANIVWDHTLTPVATFSVNAAIAKTIANGPFEGSTTQRSVIAALSSQLSPSLTVHAGMRYQILHSDITSSYREAAIFAGLSYICCTPTSRTVTGKQSSGQSSETPAPSPY